VLLPKIKKIPKNTNGRLAIPALAGLLVVLSYTYPNITWLERIARHVWIKNPCTVARNWTRGSLDEHWSSDSSLLWQIDANNSPRSLVVESQQRSRRQCQAVSARPSLRRHSATRYYKLPRWTVVALYRRQLLTTHRHRPQSSSELNLFCCLSAVWLGSKTYEYSY